MLFTFLTYLQPTHYFQRLKTNGQSVFPKVDLLPAHILSLLETDSQYKSATAQAYDLSWQAVKKGYIGEVATYTHFEPLSVFDNYVFIRKYFHPAWVLYVLVIRLLSFYNPIAELKGWLLTRHISRKVLYEHIIKYPEWDTKSSSLLLSQPKISVVIPTLNRYNYLAEVLKDLEQQEYRHFEVIVVDQSDAFNAEFYKAYQLDITVIHQEEKALWLARNTAIKKATGQLIALSEDDVRIAPDWLSNHLKCLDIFNAQVSAGVFYGEGQSLPKERSFFAIASQFATGNALLYKSVFQTVGLFDRQFEKQRMGDGEFGMRLYLGGVKSVSNPYAYCIDVKAPSGGLREMGSWDAFRPTKLFAPRPIPSVLYYYRQYFGARAARWDLLRTIPISVLPYRFKKNRPMLILGVMIAILMLPLVLYQVFSSWRLASRKLREGALIERF
uniref:glycosyltransferase family 2 protein n=1 Tax=Gelidibacter sp. TaxID=2018083 RepID=UPI00404AEC00